MLLDAQNGTTRVRNTIRITNRSDFTLELTADFNRPDVAAIFECEPQCGFVFTPPKDLFARGDTTLTFTVEPEGFELKNSPVRLPSVTGGEETTILENTTLYSGVMELLTPADGEVEEVQETADSNKILFSAVPLEKVFNKSQELSRLREKLGITNGKISQMSPVRLSADAVSEHFDRLFYLQTYSDIRDTDVRSIEPL